MGHSRAVQNANVLRHHNYDAQRKGHSILCRNPTATVTRYGRAPYTVAYSRPVCRYRRIRSPTTPGHQSADYLAATAMTGCTVAA